MSAVLNSCVLNANSAAQDGGGLRGGAANNCTITGNKALNSGGGAYNTAANNCIIYFNTAPLDANAAASTLEYCCVSPLPVSGSGNIADDPLLVGLMHIATNSPCVAAGGGTTTGLDIDQEAWAAPPSIGCDQVVAGALTGLMMPVVRVPSTQVVVNVAMDLVADNLGKASVVSWDFGDGSTLVTNQPYVSRAWSSIGTYTVTVRAYNTTIPVGLATSVVVKVVAQPIHYVNAANGTPVYPYTNWASASTNIQTALNACVVYGAKVLVTNGLYASGTVSSPEYGALNRVVLVNGVTVQSVNGPGSVVIAGAGPLGPNAVRCAYVDEGCLLAGVTLSNGFTMNVGDIVRNQGGGGALCFSGVISNCFVRNCSAGYFGGGTVGGTIYDTLFEDNDSLASGGGATYAVLLRCQLRKNRATSSGGGICSVRAYSCAVSDNSAYYGGGAYVGTLDNCNVIGNRADVGGGVNGSTVANSIIYYNTALSDDNYTLGGGMINYCCTTPLPAGAGNLTSEPKLASVTHLSSGSPCIGAGDMAGSPYTDIDGESWAITPSIGCDEWVSAGQTGGMMLVPDASLTAVAPGVPVDFLAYIDGKPASSRWTFGDGAGATNRAAVSHTWAGVGTYPVILVAYNTTYPAGISATTMVSVLNATHYVRPVNAGAAYPYDTWASAATNIQDAVDACLTYGGTILVTNGTYAAGGRAGSQGVHTNRVVLGNGMRIISVNGAGATRIEGRQPRGVTGVRCVYLERDTMISGFTLTNGTSGSSGSDEIPDNCGGAVYSDGGVVTNCIIDDCGAVHGGGVYGGWVYDSIIRYTYAVNGGGVRNVVLFGSTLANCYASQWGGGAYDGQSANCRFYTNGAGARGGGTFQGVITNSVFVGNNANNGGGSYYGVIYNSSYSNNVAAGAEGGGACEGQWYGCSFINNNSAGSGGGIYNGLASNCVIKGNTAQQGGGVYDSRLYNCLVINNSAVSYGGGVEGVGVCMINNSTICSNSAGSRGGGTDGLLWAYNSIIYYNNNPVGQDRLGGAYEYCCDPTLTNGIGNITNAPVFVAREAGNYQLAAGSPCINAGTNLDWSVGSFDLAGRPRVMDGTTEIGAYEYLSAAQDSDADGLPDWWEWDYGRNWTSSSPDVDNDGDGMTNIAEYVAGTDPNNAGSLLEWTGAVSWSAGASTGFVVRWQSVAGKLYGIERSTNLVAGTGFTNIVSDLIGLLGETSYTDTTAAASMPNFYRIEVGP